MPELILHAGAGKTGTSLLQVLFARHAEQLERDKVIYPRGFLSDEAAAGYITSGNGVAMANYIRPHLPHDIGDKEAFIGDLGRELSGARGKHVLYSSEFLVFEPGERSNAIATVAARNGYTPRVIYFVRDFGPAAFSTYSQLVKRHGETRSFSEFINDWNPHYRERIEQACAVFGPERVEVYNYDEKRDELAAFFFRTLLRCQVVPPENPIVNRSLSAKETELLRYMNAALASNAAQATFLSDALMEIATETVPEPLLLTQSEADLLESSFQSDLAYINGLIRGRPCVIAQAVGDQRQQIELTEFERATAAILAKIVSVIVR
ncbi:hypothetical protein [Mesorhizobium sp. KR9-304]|uniref:hypothetical protein n=1 Tax=Mesorhizobium sp. KR9-304 TaxID=3156614 RepID=UPI0032B3968E